MFHPFTATLSSHRYIQSILLHINNDTEREEWEIQTKYWSVNLTGSVHLGDLGIDVSIIFKWLVDEWGVCEQNSNDLAKDPKAGSCETANELAKKTRNFLASWENINVLKKILRHGLFGRKVTVNALGGIMSNFIGEVKHILN